MYKKVKYKGEVQKGRAQAQRSNTPQAPSGPERIEVAYGKSSAPGQVGKAVCKGRGSSIKVFFLIFCTFSVAWGTKHYSFRFFVNPNLNERKECHRVPKIRFFLNISLKFRATFENAPHGYIMS